MHATDAWMRDAILSTAWPPPPGGILQKRSNALHHVFDVPPMGSSLAAWNQSRGAPKTEYCGSSWHGARDWVGCEAYVEEVSDEGEATGHQRR